jgi:hypothetical protein
MQGSIGQRGGVPFSSATLYHRGENDPWFYDHGTVNTLW